MLKQDPKPMEYKLWREQIKDWLFIHEKQDFPEMTLYSVLLKSVPEEDRANYHHLVDSTERDCASLLDYLDKTHARLTQLDKTEDIAKYRNCTRKGRGLKEWRQEWERVRKVAVRAGLKPSSQDKQDFVTAAELTEQQLSQVHAGLSRAQDAHNEKVWPDGVKVEFDELAAAIKELSHYEYAEQSALGGRKSNKVPKDSDKALYAGAGMGYSDYEVNEAVYAYFGKGKGKGKGKGLGKGDNGANTKEQKPAGWKEPCQFGAGCRNMNTTCKGWHPRAKGKGKGKGKGEQRSKSEPPNANRVGSARIGGSDRDCPGCGVKVFATKLNCFKCGIKVEPVPNRPPNKGGKGQH
jgi:opacity protein-like surface antigen